MGSLEAMKKGAKDFLGKPFNEEKLRAGMLRALEKRPVDTEEIEKAINRVMKRMRASGERELPSRKLGDWVMDELRDLDQVAYVRFASVYRQFKDINEFMAELEGILKSKRDNEDL